MDFILLLFLEDLHPSEFGDLKSEIMLIINGCCLCLTAEFQSELTFWHPSAPLSFVMRLYRDEMSLLGREKHFVLFYCQCWG